jgi:hypothetical protein
LQKKSTIFAPQCQPRLTGTTNKRQVCILAHIVHGFFGYRTRCELPHETKVSKRQKLRNGILPHQAFPLAATIPKRTKEMQATRELPLILYSSRKVPRSVRNAITPRMQRNTPIKGTFTHRKWPARNLLHCYRCPESGINANLP